MHNQNYSLTTRTTTKGKRFTIVPKKSSYNIPSKRRRTSVTISTSSQTIQRKEGNSPEN